MGLVFENIVCYRRNRNCLAENKSTDGDFFAFGAFGSTG